MTCRSSYPEIRPEEASPDTTYATFSRSHLRAVIIAFVVIGLYFYYGKLIQTISQKSTRTDPTTLVSYAIPIALATVATVLLLGLWNMMPGGSPNTSQTLMRWRVLLQFIALCLVMAALYLSGKY